MPEPDPSSAKAMASSLDWWSGGPLAGLAYLLRSLHLFRTQPRLMGYIVVPIVLNLGLGIALYTGLLLPGLSSIDALVANLPTWAKFLDTILNLLLAIALFIALGFLLVQCGVILGSPWYGQLSEQLEQQYLVSPMTPTKGSNVLSDLGRAIAYEVKKLLVSLGIAGLLLILGIVIPGLGTTMATLGSVALSAFIVCLDCFDAPLERRRWRFRTKVATVFRTLPASASFGLTSLVLVSIPFLNLVTVPLCVTAGTLLVCDRVLRQHDQSQ